MESERGNVAGNGADTGGEQSPSGRGPVFPTPPKEDVGEGTESDPAPIVEHLSIEKLEDNIIDSSHYSTLENVIRYTHRLGSLCEKYRDKCEELEQAQRDPASLLRLKYAPFLEHLEADELVACILDAVKDNDMEDVVHYTQRLGNLCEYYRRLKTSSQ